MRKVILGAAFLLPFTPAAVAAALTTPATPATPAIDFGRGVDAGANPADPTANDPELVTGEVVKVGLGGTYGFVQVGNENTPMSLGRIGVKWYGNGLRVYAEDYTTDNAIARALDPVIQALLPADPDCPAADDQCDAVLVTVFPPVDVPPVAPPAIPSVHVPPATFDQPSIPKQFHSDASMPTIPAPVPAPALPAPQPLLTSVGNAVGGLVHGLLG